MHAQLMLLLHWEPEKVWRLKIFLAVRLLREELKLHVTRTRITALVVSSFLSRNSGASEMLASVMGEDDKRITVEDQFGEKIAREAKELEDHNRQWIKERRGQ